jgi:hypothetical protein
VESRRPGSFTSIMMILPFTSTPWKSSHCHSGAVIPNPTKTSSLVDSTLAKPGTPGRSFGARSGICSDQATKSSR